MASVYAVEGSEGLLHTPIPTTTTTGTTNTQQGQLELDFPWLNSAPFSPTLDVSVTPGGIGSGHQQEDTSTSLLDLLEGHTAGGRNHLADLFDFWSPAQFAVTTPQQGSSPAPGTDYTFYHQRAGSPSTSGSMTSPEPARLSLASSGYHSNSLSSPPTLEELEGVKTPSPGGQDHQEQWGSCGVDPMEREDSSVYLTPPPSVKLEHLEQSGHAPSRPDSVHSDSGSAHSDLSSTHWSPVSSPAAAPTPAVVKSEAAKSVPAKIEPAKSVAAKSDPSKKPLSTYIELVARALLTVPSHKMILADIYADILQRYPYYETAPSTWRNAVRHNLCVNDCFIKAGRSNSGRGFFWAIHPACVEMFAKGDFRRVQARRLAQQMNNAKAAANAAVITASSTHMNPTPSHQASRLTAVTMSGYAHPATPSLVATPTATYQAMPYGSHAYNNRYYGGNHAPQMATTYQYYPQHYASSAPSCQSLYATPMYR